LRLPSPPSGDLGGFGATIFTSLINICSGYSLQSFLFVPHKKGFPLLSRSPSAENLYSTFTKAEIDEKIEAEIEKINKILKTKHSQKAL
jgi:hypothetical protein